MKHRRRLISLFATLAVALAVTHTAPAGAADPGAVTPVAEHGFGDRDNSYAWSMAWFKGKLYVGTARSFQCVEGVTYDFFFPNLGLYPAVPLPDFSCPDDKYALDLRAEIWQFTPASGEWERVYRSPVIPNPRAPGRNIARNIGFRGMAVYREPSGRQALYVGGVTAGEYIPELGQAHAPDILRSTDGRSFKPIGTSAGTIETVFGTQRPVSYRAMVVNQGRLFVSVSAGLAGDGVILEVKRPWTARPELVQASPSTMRVYEMASFNGYLYAGGGSTTTGYSVWKAKVDGDHLNFRPVVEGGAGRGAAMTSVLSMEVFKRRLYVSATGWYGVLLPSSELIRINPDDTWDVVVGSPRTVPGAGMKYPVSGLPDGFGNFLNAHFWRSSVDTGAMYVGTNDMSWTFRFIPFLDWLLQWQFGFDVYGTCDGTYWWSATTTAFGDGRYNFGARTMVSTPKGEFIGSANFVQGTEVWRMPGSPCAPTDGLGGVRQAGSGVGPSARAATASTPQSSKLLATVEPCGTVLSWKRSAPAHQYRVLRAQYRRAPQLLSYDPLELPGSVMPDTPVLRRRAGPSPDSRGAPWILGPFERVGTTTGATFVDRSAARGGRYLYKLVVDGTSAGSDLALVPSARPAASFREADAGIRALDRQGIVPARSLGAQTARSGQAALLGVSRDARASWRRGDRVAAIQALGRLRRGVAAVRSTADVRDVLDRLERRLTVTQTACVRR